MVALGLGSLLGTPPFARLQPDLNGWLLGTVATLPALALVSLCSLSKAAPIQRLLRLSRDKLAPLFQGASLTQLLLIATAAGIGEEALFRGVVQSALTDHLPVPLAILLASVLFGLAHYITAGYAVFATLFGLYLGWLSWWTDNLLVAIVTHTLYDWLVLWYLVGSNRR